MITVTVFAPPEEHSDNTTRAMSFVEGVLSEAKLLDRKPTSLQSPYPIRKTLQYLINRYPGRIAVRWVDPWSLHGLIFAIVNRQRTFPAVFIKSKMSDLVLTNENLNELSDHIAEFLAQTDDS